MTGGPLGPRCHQIVSACVTPRWSGDCILPRTSSSLNPRLVHHGEAYGGDDRGPYQGLGHGQRQEAQLLVSRERFIVVLNPLVLVSNDSRCVLLFQGRRADGHQRAKEAGQRGGALSQVSQDLVNDRAGAAKDGRVHITCCSTSEMLA